MRRFVEGTYRGQSTLFPECLEDWICEDNPVRAVDVEKSLSGDHVKLHVIGHMVV
jgi:hypothetical protein